jgi:hypothetical protein
MIAVHRIVGLTIGALFGALALWGLVLWIRNRNPGNGFWRLLAVAQAGLGVQILVGIFMLLTKGGRPPLHYVYGGFPLLVLYFAHRYAKKLEGIEWIAFAIAGLVIFGLQVRGFMTGIGM